MAKMDVRDNDCIGRSPCIGCEREYEDKSKCARTCDRLAAYRSSEKLEGKEDVGIEAAKETKTRDHNPEIRDKKCLIHGCDETALKRGLCDRHYQQWRKGNIEHPVLGKFIVSQTHIKPKITKAPAQKTKIKETEAGGQESEDRSQRSEIRAEVGNRRPEVVESVETCVICHNPDKKILNKRSKTCRACYQAWRVGTKEHPTLGQFKPSQVHIRPKRTKDQKIVAKDQKAMAKDPVPIVKEQRPIARDQKTEEILDKDGSLITLNLDDYPRIKRQINYLSEKYFVPPKHVIIDMIGEALSARKEAATDHG